MKEPKQQFILYSLVIFIFAVIAVKFFTNKSTQLPLRDYTQKQLSSIEVLETLDLNSEIPKFRLHVQTHLPGTENVHGNSHDPFNGVPQKLLLFDNETKETVLELPLADSMYQNECIAHHDMLDTVKKWDTEWFSIAGFETVDTSYTPKLKDKYSVTVIYSEERADVPFASVNSISNVCYQFAQAIPVRQFFMEESPEY